MSERIQLPEHRTHYRPSEIASARGVDVDTVRRWIASGELPAIDCSTTRGGKPRWRVSGADLAVFDANRRSKTEAPMPRIRRRRDPAVREWF